MVVSVDRVDLILSNSLLIEPSFILDSIADATNVPAYSFVANVVSKLAIVALFVFRVAFNVSNLVAITESIVASILINSSYAFLAMSISSNAASTVARSS